MKRTQLGLLAGLSAKTLAWGNALPAGLTQFLTIPLLPPRRERWWESGAEAGEGHKSGLNGNRVPTGSFTIKN